MTIERLAQVLLKMPNQKATALILLGESDLMEIQNVFDFSVYHGKDEFANEPTYNMEGIGKEIEAALIRVKSETFSGA